MALPSKTTIADRVKAAAGRLRPHHFAAVAGLAVLGLGAMTVRSVALPGPAPVLDGDRLHIQVVAPVEPEITPGSVMDVGTLVDGFVYRPPPRPAPEPAAYAPYDEDYGLAEERSDRRRSVDYAEVYAPPQPEPPKENWRDSRAARWFGFDAPERDYRAEREARRARREAMEAERRDGRNVRWYRSDGQPVDDRREPRREYRRDEGGRPYDGPYERSPERSYERPYERSYDPRY